MEKLLFIFLAIPISGLLFNLLVPRRFEKLLSVSTYMTMIIQAFFAFVFIGFWAWNGFESLYSNDLSIYQEDHFHFALDFYFDKVTAVYVITGALLSFLITAFARRYLHKEPGYKRFFNTILSFYFGYNIIVLSGNLATLFIGWELAGVSSFLLIAYYRERYLPVKNAVKIFSIYRLGDIALILAMWASHHIWHDNIGLNNLADQSTVLSEINEHPKLSLIFGFSILVAAVIKSAQFPFSSWLPRALEGPTPSSAIFYTSLSIHIGALLLLRTHGYWDELLPVKIAVIGLGAFTFIFATVTSRVQPSIKGQIAYSGIAQVGLIFVEISLGWYNIALIHFTGNAFLKSYQLLISPSVVTYYIREQFYHFIPQNRSRKQNFFNKVTNTLYIKSLREFRIDNILHHALWNNFKTIGLWMKRLSPTSLFAILIFFSILSALIKLKFWELNDYWISFFPYFIFAFACISALRSFVVKKHVYHAPVEVLISNLFLLVGIWVALDIPKLHIYLYLGGIVFSFAITILLIWILKKREPKLNLVKYQGHSYEHKGLEILSMLSFLGMFSFPVTTAFLGLELALGAISVDQASYLVLILITLFVLGLSMIRM